MVRGPLLLRLAGQEPASPVGDGRLAGLDLDKPERHEAAERESRHALAAFQVQEAKPLDIFLRGIEPAPSWRLGI